ncbi:MAG TPA: hypothetical protein VFX48_03985, partial [Saprospiraceae bacterium]|nr:hypothetical protein [Saprospiraceae bacterium]
PWVTKPHQLVLLPAPPCEHRGLQGLGIELGLLQEYPFSSSKEHSIFDSSQVSAMGGEHCA